MLLILFIFLQSSNEFSVYDFDGNRTFFSAVLLGSEFPTFSSVLLKKTNQEKIWTKTKRLSEKIVTFTVKNYDLTVTLICKNILAKLKKDVLNSCVDFIKYKVICLQLPSVINMTLVILV